MAFISEPPSNLRNFTTPSPQLFGTPELLRKEYGKRKLKTLVVIEAMDT